MKTIITLILLFSFNFLAISSMKAFFLEGEEITYQCLGGNNYEVAFVLYRNCSSTPPPDSVVIKCSSSCNASFTIMLNVDSSTGNNIIPECPTAKSSCNGGQNIGIQKWIYKANVALPVPCADWLFSCSGFVRNGAITTVQDAGVDSLYVEARLNNTLSCHASPVFNSDPLISVCVDTWSSIDCSASSPCDSLVYSLIASRIDSGINVVYNAGYSATQPFGNVPATFDSVTGLLTFYPTSLLIGPYVVLVKQYSNGVLIGTVMRDIILYTASCTNHQPMLTGINGTNVDSIIIPANKTSCFNLFSSDSDLVQSTTLSWDSAIAGATFTVDTSFNQSAQFCWQPFITDTGSCTHCFTAKVNDDYCPIEGSRSYQFCITVVDSGFASVNTYSDLKQEVLVSPNPFNSFTTITLLTSSHSLNQQFILYDAVGRILMNKSMYQNSLVIERNNLSSGMYFFSIVDGDKRMATGKLLITD